MNSTRRSAAWYERQLRFWWPRRHRGRYAQRHVQINVEMLRKARTS